MSRQLDSLKEKYSSNATLTTLIEFLEQCKKEEAWDEIISVIDDWKGSETTEIHFYYGIALLYTGKREEGADRLLKVVKSNPNHFNAKKELEKFNISQEDEKSASELTSDGLSKILVVENKIEQNEYYRKLKYRNIMIVIIFIGLALYFIPDFFKPDKSQGFDEKVKEPEKYFHSENYTCYNRTIRDYKVLQIREEIGEPLKKAIFYMTAYAILDYRLERERDDLSQFKLFSTQIDKDEQSKSLIDYIEGSGNPVGTNIYHKFEKEYPDSLNEIKMLGLEIPEKVDKSNLRETFYKALMLFRRKDYSSSKKVADMILKVFPEHELSSKLVILIKASSAIDDNRSLNNITAEKQILERYKTESSERSLYGEALYLLGKASGREDMVREAFYTVCPDKFFCKETVLEFMNKGATTEASRMALFIKDQNENTRNAQDVKLVMVTSKADSDYSNCYFAFKELQQFFPESVDDETISAGAECSEMNGYYEEAVKAYEQVNDKKESPDITGKILRMKFIMTRDELYFNQLKALAEKNSDNLDILYSYLEALKKTGDIPQTVSTLDKIYKLEVPEKRMSVINEYLENGAVMQAVENLKENLETNKEYRIKLSEIYNRYMLFNMADEVLKPGEDHDPVWKFFKEQYLLLKQEEIEHVLREVDKKLQSSDHCEPAFLYLKAEVFRRQGDRQRTLGMIDAILECDRFYLPGLVFAAEITYYQGDIQRATDGLTYILDHEKYFSPGDYYYRNYMVLLNAEIMVTLGRDAQLEKYLSRNLVKSIPLGEKEMDKVNDIASKLKSSRQKGFMDYLRRNFKIKKSEN
jgi:hypothetical protein